VVGMKQDETGIFKTELVTGDCPECNCKSMLVKVYNNIYRCVNCGEDIEQKVNGVIKYMKVDSDTKMALREFMDG
jgi:transcription elongation factor Elf1